MKSNNRSIAHGEGNHISRWAQLVGLLVSSLLLGAGQTPAQAQVVYNPANGHYYELIVPNVLLDWEDSRVDAQKRTYLGLRGHMATLTSDQEEQFVSTNMPAALHYALHLGGYQDLNAPDYSEPSGGWRWVTGEPWVYTDWYPGEPTNGGGTENYLGFFAPFGHWNDTNNDLGGYVIEYESYPPLFHYDFDGDGKADLVFQNQTTNQVALWNMNGSTVNGGSLLSDVPAAGYQVAGIGDFNYDGHPDLLFQNQTTGQLVLWYMNGAVRTDGVLLTATPGAGYKVVGIGDFNGDGKMDLIFQNQTTNQIVFWFLNRANVIGGASLPQVPVSGYKVVGVGDFNGDGQLDLLFQNQTSGTLTAWFLNGTSFVGGLGISTLPGTGWQVKGVADYNADGHQDLMLQNQTTGQVTLWYMNGVNLLSSSTLSATPSAGYQVVGPR